MRFRCWNIWIASGSRGVLEMREKFFSYGFPPIFRDKAEIWLDPSFNPWQSLDPFFGKLQFQSQGISQPIGEVSQPRQHVHINDFGIRKLFLQLVEVGFGDFVRGTRQLLDVN